MRRLLIVIGILALAGWLADADAAVTGEWRVNLLRGSSTIATVTGATEGEAWANCRARIPASATTSTSYRCQTLVYAATVTPDAPACPPQPADETQPGTCPAGTTGTWTQTRTYSSAPAPTCWTAGAWAPTLPPTGACVAPPPVTIAQLVYSATAGGTYAKLDGATVAGSINVRLDGTCPNPPGPWSYYLDAATAPVNIENLCPYELIGDNALFDTKTLSNSAHSLRVVGSTTIAATFTVANAAPPPPPTGTGTATLEWTPPALNTDGSALTNLAGYRIVYGASVSALVSTVQVPNPALQAYVIENLPSGTWFFAVRAYATSGAESDNSNVASKVVP